MGPGFISVGDQNMEPGLIIGRHLNQEYTRRSMLWDLCAPVSRSAVPAGPARCPISAGPRTQASPGSQGPGRPPDVRCISPASKSRRAASVQERSPLGVGVPRAIPAWRGWGLMLSGSEKLGTLGGDRAPLPKSQSRVEAPWPAARCAPAVLSEAANANPGSLPRCPCEPRPTPPQPEPRFLIC